MDVVHALLAYEPVMAAISIDLERKGPVQAVALIFHFDYSEAGFALQLSIVAILFDLFFYLLELFSLEFKFSWVHVLHKSTF